MGLYAIGDLHLSLSVNKPMDIFGEVWKDHTEKLRASFSQLRDDDTIVLCGDTSWGISLEEALEDWTDCPAGRSYSKETTITGGRQRQK